MFDFLPASATMCHLTFLPLLILLGVINATPPVRITTGAFVSSIQDITLYDAVIPRFYVHQLPQADLLNLTSVLENICQDKASIACSARRAAFAHLHHTSTTLNNLLKSFSESAAGLQFPSPEDSSEENFEYPHLSTRLRRSAFGFIGNFMGYCCDVATKEDISDIYTDEDAMDNFMKAAKDSIVQNHQSLIMITNKTSEIYGRVNKTLQRFKIQIDHLTKFSTAKTAHLTNVTRELQKNQLYDLLITTSAIQLDFWTSEVLRLISITGLCNNKQLSPLTLSHDELNQDLRKLKPLLAANNFTLAIPDSKIGMYYRLKLVTCVMSQERLTIRLNIPISEDPSRLLWSIKRVPFRWNNQTCQVRIDSTLIAVGHRTAVISGTELSQCIPASGLCKIPAHHSDLLHGSNCPLQLLQQSTVDTLNNACLLECSPLQGMVVSHVAHHHYVISGIPEGSVLKCPNETLPLQSPLKGSLDIRLNCFCTIDIPNHQSIRPPFPCTAFSAAPTEITHIIPAAWTPPTSQQISVLTQHSMSTYQNLSDALNENWKVDLPSVELTVPENILNIHRKIPKLIHHSSFILPSFSMIWNALLSLAVLWLLYQQSRTMPLWTSLHHYFRPAAAETPIDSALATLETSLIVVLVINVIFIIIITGFAIYFLCRSVQSPTFSVSEDPEANQASPAQQAAGDPAADLPPSRKQKKRQR